MSETCRRSQCHAPLSDRRIVLINPDGSDGKTCGPYCDPHTDAVRKNLMPTYSGGGDAYRIDRVESR